MVSNTAPIISPRTSPVEGPSGQTRPQVPALGALPFPEFVWGAGVECSFLPHLNVDQFQWTQHNRFWRDDLRRAREDLGITHLRYALPWNTLEPRRGEYDWSMSDERIEEIRKLGFN
ncbi:MAG: hypothetical protein JWP03_88, partial [Phycisphaerales bacterium]|nr:hypothetical protein [Phycisphaerales bacterium]